MAKQYSIADQENVRAVLAKHQISLSPSQLNKISSLLHQSAESFQVFDKLKFAQHDSNSYQVMTNSLTWGFMYLFQAMEELGKDLDTVLRSLAEMESDARSRVRGPITGSALADFRKDLLTFTIPRIRAQADTLKKIIELGISYERIAERQAK